MSPVGGSFIWHRSRRLVEVIRATTRWRLTPECHGHDKQRRAASTRTGYLRVADNPGVGPSMTTKASVVTKGTHLSSATRLHSDRRDTELNL
jgi:hypothetical protein